MKKLIFILFLTPLSIWGQIVKNGGDIQATISTIDWEKATPCIQCPLTTCHHYMYSGTVSIITTLNCPNDDCCNSVAFTCVKCGSHVSVKYCELDGHIIPRQQNQFSGSSISVITDSNHIFSITQNPNNPIFNKKIDAKLVDLRTFPETTTTTPGVIRGVLPVHEGGSPLRGVWTDTRYDGANKAMEDAIKAQNNLIEKYEKLNISYRKEIKICRTLIDLQYRLIAKYEKQLGIPPTKAIKKVVTKKK